MNRHPQKTKPRSIPDGAFVRAKPLKIAPPGLGFGFAHSHNFYPIKSKKIAVRQKISDIT